MSNLRIPAGFRTDSGFPRGFPRESEDASEGDTESSQ